MVPVGTTCVDTYEASVWDIPAANRKLIKRVREGKATLADLLAGGATQVGCTVSPYNHAAIPSSFPLTGNWTAPHYAASIVGVLASACLTWFQAEQACALSGKRVLTNQEWQRTVTGTIDPATDDLFTTCNVGSGLPRPAGSRASCVSQYGAFDMVGNLAEWTAEWADLHTGDCRVSFADDELCFGGDGSVPLPGARLRGGSANDGRDGGAFALSSALSPDSAQPRVGFRCAR
jgi:hypothetical protein